ncbi:MAG: hypothetical protein D6790_15050 [Caldilineae bacterium]|nr:MAG: hypothetical protein D6790_15050 [Caldilineae bacterium]
MKVITAAKGQYVGDAEAEVMACLYITGNDVPSAIELYQQRCGRSEVSFRNRLYRMRKKDVLTPLLPVDLLRTRKVTVYVALD